MTNKKFKKAAMALALTACVAATPLAANAETPENAAGAQAPAAVDHAEADTQEAPEAELPVEEEPGAQPAAEAAAQPAAPEAPPIAVELPTAEETPEEKEETPVEVTPTEDAVVEKETPAKIAPAPAKVAPAAAKANADIPMENPDADIAAEDPDAGIATMDGAEKEVSGDAATIGKKNYGTLDDALKDAKTGDEVVLQKDHTGNITIAEWIKLNLNKHKIEGNVDVDLSGKKGDTATSQDGEADANKKVEIVDGKITGAKDSGVTVKDAGDTNVLLKDLTIEKNEGKQGGGVHIENSQNVTIDHCIIRDNKTTEVSKNGTDVSLGAGGGVFVSDKSHVTITDSKILDNTGTRGGGVYVENSTVKVEDSTIDNNTANDVPSDSPTSNKGVGGGIYSFDSTLAVTDSTISNNTAEGHVGLFKYKSNGRLWSSAFGKGGGGICAVGKKSDVTLDGVTVTDNKATYNNGVGGGINAQGGKLTVTNSTIISDNNARGNGGGIASEEGNVLNVSGSTIQGNTGNNGGGIHFGERFETTAPTTATITDTKILDNKATGSQGGGVYVATNSTATLTNSTVAGNETTSMGGGICGSLGSIALDNVQVENNKVTATDGMGGGVFLQGNHNGAGTLTLKNGTNIKNNAAGYGGGVFLKGDAKLNSDGADGRVTISNNTAAIGAGIFTQTWVFQKLGITCVPGIVLNNTDILGNAATQNGGGIYATDGVTITAKDSSISNNSAGGWAGGVFAYNGVVINAENTKFLNNTADAAGGVYAAKGVVLNAKNTKFLGNTAKSGGGILLWDNSSADLNNSEVSGNKATGNGGGVYIWDSTCSLTASNGTVFRENSASNGGGIFSSGGAVTAEDSTFEKNTAVMNGGAIAATQNSSLTVRSSKVLENTSGDKAGGILAEKSTLEVTDSIIDGNRASLGGGLYISDIDAPGETKEDKPEHTITRTEITNNTADGMGIGGGIYLGAQKLTITDSKLTGNNTISKNGQTQGGAIVAYSPGDFTLDNTLIQGNTADIGGGIHVLSTDDRDSHIILCNNTRITGNVANLFGGGIFLDNMNNPAVLELVNASVDNNTANVAGGIGNYGSIVVLKDGAVLENNTAKQYGGGLYNRGKVTVESGATVMNNTASTYGGGLYNKGEATVESGAKLYNNHAALAGDDIYLAGKGSTLTLTKVGDDWMLDDCGHKINGWFLDGLDARWDADGKGEHVTNLDDFKADGYAVTKNEEDGSYTITITDDNATLALKAAHNVIPKPNPEPTPDPDTPDTPVSPEGPTTPPVQDATPDDAETPVNPENPTNPPVQDATPDSTVAALPKTGVNWFTALAMAMSGMALTVAGAFTSLFAKSKH